MLLNKKNQVYCQLNGTEDSSVPMTYLNLDKLPILNHIYKNANDITHLIWY